MSKEKPKLMTCSDKPWQHDLPAAVHVSVVQKMKDGSDLPSEPRTMVCRTTLARPIAFLDVSTIAPHSTWHREDRVLGLTGMRPSLVVENVPLSRRSSRRFLRSKAEGIRRRPCSYMVPMAPCTPPLDLSPHLVRQRHQHLLRRRIPYQARKRAQLARRAHSPH